MFIYCTKEEIKETLVELGFNLITETEQENNKQWIFEFNENIPLPDFEDKTAFYLSKKMSF